MKDRPTRNLRRMSMLAAAVTLLLILGATPALAGSGGNPGPCLAGTDLEDASLGLDVSFVARFVGTPLPEVFAFEEGPPPMPPGQLLQFARSVGLC